MGIVNTLTEYLSIKRKKRQDSLTDQYNRLLMVKMCVLCSMIIGYDFFKDKVTCVYSQKDSKDYTKFVGSTCWIQGFYVYEEMKDRLADSSYFGIPRNIDFDGIDDQGKLCATIDRAHDKDKTCRSMTKQYFLQYQYMPFFTASLSILFYIPYILYQLINHDMVNLQKSLEDKCTSEDLCESFFEHGINTKSKMRYRVAFNFIIKIFYLVANIIAFVTTDWILYSNFSSFGINYSKWNELSDNKKNDHSLKVRAVPKAGNILLPPMGYCDVHQLTRDVRNTFINTNRYLCEISAHVIYQYVMLVLWGLLVVGMIISVLGVLLYVCEGIRKCSSLKLKGYGKAYDVLTLREIEYLDYIVDKDMEKYRDIMKRICEKRGVK